MKLSDFCRRFLQFFTFLFVLLGLAIFILGLYILQHQSHLRDKYEVAQLVDLGQLARVTIGIGTGVFVVSSIGLVGACLKNAFCLWIWALFAIAGIVLKLYLLWWYFNEFNIDNYMKDDWFAIGTEGMERRYGYQHYFHCCGWSQIYDSVSPPFNTQCPFTDPITCKQATLNRLSEYDYIVYIVLCVWAGLEFLCVLAFMPVAVFSDDKEIVQGYDISESAGAAGVATLLPPREEEDEEKTLL